LNLFIYSEDIITSHNPYLLANIIYKRNEELRVKYLVKAADHTYFSKGLYFFSDDMGLGKTLQCISLIWWVNVLNP